MPDAATGLVYYVVFLFSTTLHEAAHAWAALLGGDRTAYHGGQVTLDPRPHIKREPFGMVVLPLLTALASGWPIGFASAPFDPHWALRYPKRAGWMALAGPGANLLLMLITALGIRIGVATHVFYAPDSVRFGHIVATGAAGAWPSIAFLLGAFFSMNLVLASLNLIPLPPLDGASAIPVFLHNEGAVKYQEFMLGPGRALSFLGMVVAWRLFDVVFRPIFLLALNLLHPGLHYGG